MRQIKTWKVCSGVVAVNWLLFISKLGKLAKLATAEFWSFYFVMLKFLMLMYHFCLYACKSGGGTKLISHFRNRHKWAISELFLNFYLFTALVLCNSFVSCISKNNKVTHFIRNHEQLCKPQQLVGNEISFLEKSKCLYLGIYYICQIQNVVWLLRFFSKHLPTILWSLPSHQQLSITHKSN